MGCDIHEHYEYRAWPADPERAALLRTCRERPADRAPRLVYADWLQDRGLDGRAAAVRAGDHDDLLDLELPWVEHDWERLEAKAPDAEFEWEKPGYLGRNYWLFWALAGVRGGPGKPFEAPRGLPTDVSPTVLAEWTSCVHPSERALAEHLGRWDWKAGALRAPVTGADRDAYAAEQRAWYRDWFRRTGGREDWYGGGDGARRWLVEGELCTALDWHSTSWLTLAEVKARRWHPEVRKSAGDFFRRAVPMMARLGAPEDVRFVFWFDN